MRGGKILFRRVKIGRSIRRPRCRKNKIFDQARPISTSVSRDCGIVERSIKLPPLERDIISDLQFRGGV